MKRPLDALLLVILVLARARIDSLADLVLPNRHQDFSNAPLLGQLIPPRSRDLLADWLTDPLGLILLSSAFGVLLIYLLFDAAGRNLPPTSQYRVKRFLIWLLILLMVIVPTLKLVLLRQVGGPASYAHDGGVIQTEETVRLFLEGRNPYSEDYGDTPLAEWGIDYHSAIYHYPYLPWTFVFSAPFQLLSTRLLGWFDQRFIYLFLYALVLLLVPRLVETPIRKLTLIMTLGLNPIMGTDVIFGQNDVFVLFWVVLGLWFIQRRRFYLGMVAYGLACASKPTAWFLAPFLLLLLLDGREPSDRKPLQMLLHRSWPGLVTVGLLVLPYVVWDLNAMVDDIWRWSAGTAAVPYQIRGWGFANFVLAAGLVESRLDYWPFWLPQLLVCLPLLIILLRQQWRENTLSNACWNYGLLLFTFFFMSRFLNENYLGYVLAFLVVGYGTQQTGGE